MPDPRPLLDDLTRRGVRLSARDQSLVVDAPKGVLTVSDRAAPQARKHGSLELLTPRPVSWEEPALGDDQPGIVTERPDRADA
jgi:hypothetical protein